MQQQVLQAQLQVGEPLLITLQQPCRGLDATVAILRGASTADG